MFLPSYIHRRVNTSYMRMRNKPMDNKKKTMCGVMWTLMCYYCRLVLALLLLRLWCVWLRYEGKATGNLIYIYFFRLLSRGCESGFIYFYSRTLPIKREIIFIQKRKAEKSGRYVLRANKHTRHIENKYSSTMKTTSSTKTKDDSIKGFWMFIWIVVGVFFLIGRGKRGWGE